MNKFVVFLLFMEIAFALQITEIHPKPLSDETFNEWIEIFNDNDEIMDVAGFMIGDSKDNDTIEGGEFGGSGTLLFPGQYGIITDSATRVYDNFNVSSDVLRLYSEDASIGNGLSNGGETIYLYEPNGTLIDTVTYVSVLSGLSYSLVNGSFVTSSPSPGFGASVFSFSTLTLCDWSVSIVTNGTEFSDDFSFKVLAINEFGSSTNLSAIASIHDVSGNLIKKYTVFNSDPAVTRKTSRTYNPNLGASVYLLSTYLNVSCEDSNINNNEDQKLITVVRDGEVDSFVSIENILDLGRDEAASLGDVIRVKLSLYRGDTSKRSVKLWIENVGKIVSITLPDTFTKYDITVPLSIPFDCIDSGDYDVIVEGLGERDVEEIEIESNCGEDGAKISKTKTYEFELLDFPSEIENKLDFNLSISNNDKEDHDFTVWSYVFRGSKSYSGERETNKEVYRVDSGENKLVQLQNSVEAPAGDYKLKVKILRDSLKTPVELNEEIKVIDTLVEKVAIKKEINNEKVEIAKNNFKTTLRPRIVYESRTLTAKKLVPYLMILSFAMISLTVVWQR